MRETFEKEESMFIEIVNEEGKKYLINKKYITLATNNRLFLGNDGKYVDVNLTYEEIKQKLGVK